MLIQKPQHVHIVINCQYVFVNNLALSFVCYWSHVYDFTWRHQLFTVNQTIMMVISIEDEILIESLHETTS